MSPGFLQKLIQAVNRHCPMCQGTILISDFLVNAKIVNVSFHIVSKSFYFRTT